MQELSIHLQAEDGRGVWLKLVLNSKYKGVIQYFSPRFNNSLQFFLKLCKIIFKQLVTISFFLMILTHAYEADSKKREILCVS